MQKIYVYIILINLLLLSSGKGLAQKSENKEELPPAKLWNGCFIHVDAASVITTAFSNGDSRSVEGGIQVDLKHRFFPVIELGYASADKLSKENIGFKTNGMFGRIGIDFNMSKPKKDNPSPTNFFLAGIRLGMTNASYEYTNTVITDDYWGGSEVMQIGKLPSTKVWYELVAGVRVNVFKNFYMGWNVRSKTLFGNNDVSGKIHAWYIPGFGVSSSTAWAFNYVLGVKL